MTDYKNYDMKVDTLAKFGPSFQAKAVAVMLNSPDFLAQSFDVINPNFFELDANKWIVKTTLEYFNDYRTLPTLEVFKLEISKGVKDEDLRVGIIEQLRGIFKRMTDTDLDYVKDSFLEFGKNQAIKTAILESVDLLEIGQYGEIKSIIDAAMRSGQPKTMGHDWKKDIELRLTKNARDVVPTGWDIIDVNIGGGLAAGELGVIAAPSGIGKCVDGNTELTISYEEYCIELDKEEIWFGPWDTIQVRDTPIKGGQLITKTRTVHKTITMESLFTQLGIPEKEHAEFVPEFSLLVLGDKGYFPIRKLFRTHIQNSATLTTENGCVLKCGHDHQIMTLRGWVKSCDLQPTDELITKFGPSKVSSCVVDETLKPLYDISVENVHSYYSSDILSHNSWALATIGANALKSGKKVIHYTLELNEGYVGLRYDTIYTGIEPSKIPEHPELIRELVGKISGEIIIKYYPAKTVSCHSIQAHVQQLASLGFKPDVIIVDYADLLFAVAKTDARYQELGAIYEELRGLAGELKVPIWTASQTQRCLTLNTLVDTPSGPRKLGSLVVGDIVDTHLGFKKVTKVFPIETQGTYEITLKSGKKIQCSARHEFPTAKNTLMSIETGLAVGVELLTKRHIIKIKKRVSMKHSNFYRTYRMNIEDFIIDEIVDIKFIGEMETVDISVEDTHMFYANGIYTHNSSIQDEVIQADKIAESYSKIMTADLVISISRKLEDKMTKTGRAHVIKNRFGPDGQTFPMVIDTYTGTIEIFDETSAKGVLLKKQMQQGAVATKQNLAKKLADMDFDNIDG